MSSGIATSCPSTASPLQSTWSKRRASRRPSRSQKLQPARVRSASCACVSPRAATYASRSAPATASSRWSAGCRPRREWRPAASAGSSQADRLPTRWSWKTWRSQETMWSRWSSASPRRPRHCPRTPRLWKTNGSAEIKLKAEADSGMVVWESRDEISRGLSLQTLTAFDSTSFSSSHSVETQKPQGRKLEPRLGHERSNMANET